MAETEKVEKAPAKKAPAAKASADTAPAEKKAAPAKAAAGKATAAKAAPAKATVAKAAPAKAKAAKEETAVRVSLLKVHHLRPAVGAKKERTRVGRGEGSKGKTAGRGTKGTGARKNVPASFEGGQLPLHMRLPKLKGFRNRFKTTFQVVNVGQLAALFPAGGTVGTDDLVVAGAVRPGQPVKVLGDGDIAGVKLDVTAHAFSGSAIEKITGAGGTTTAL